MGAEGQNHLPQPAGHAAFEVALSPARACTGWAVVYEDAPELSTRYSHLHPSHSGPWFGMGLCLPSTAELDG